MLLGMYKLLEANKKEINLRNGTANIYHPQTHTGHTVCCLLHKTGWQGMGYEHVCETHKGRW